MKFFLIVITFFSHHVLAANAKIDVLSQAIVDGQEILLKDIIKTENISDELRNKISRVVIGNAPQAGEVRKFSSYAISEIIRYNLKNVQNDVSLKIPSEISVLRKGEKLSAEEVKKKLIAWVGTSCSPCEVEVESIRLQDPGVLDDSVSWNIPTLQQIPKGQFAITVDLYKSENLYKKIIAQGNLRIFKNVYAAKRDLPFGAKIQKEDIFIRKEDVTFSREVAPEEHELLGSEAAQNIVSSQVLWKKNLKRKMALQRGAPVQVVVKNSAWRINLSGIAQGGGYIGDVVTVLNPGTKKIITGIIRDENLVEVQ